MHETNKGVQDALNVAHGFEKTLVSFFAQFPHLPEDGRKVLAQIVPWFALVVGILGIISFIGVLGAGTVAMTVSGGLGSVTGIQGMLNGGVFGIVLLVSVILGLAVAILELLAFQPLKKNMKKGWNFLFYGLLIGALSTSINVVGSALLGQGVGSLIGGVLGFLIGGWILFEIRSHFTK